MYNGNTVQEREIREKYNEIFRIVGEQVGFNKLNYEVFTSLNDNDVRKRKINSILSYAIVSKNDNKINACLKVIDSNLKREDRIEDKVNNFFKLGEKIYPKQEVKSEEKITKDMQQPEVMEGGDIEEDSQIEDDKEKTELGDLKAEELENESQDKKVSKIKGILSKFNIKKGFKKTLKKFGMGVLGVLDFISISFLAMSITAGILTGGLTFGTVALFSALPVASLVLMFGPSIAKKIKKVLSKYKKNKFINKNEDSDNENLDVDKKLNNEEKLDFGKDLSNNEELDFGKDLEENKDKNNNPIQKPENNQTKNVQNPNNQINNAKNLKEKSNLGPVMPNIPTNNNYRRPTSNNLGPQNYGFKDNTKGPLYNLNNKKKDVVNQASPIKTNNGYINNYGFKDNTKGPLYNLNNKKNEVVNQTSPIKTEIANTPSNEVSNSESRKEKTILEAEQTMMIINKKIDEYQKKVNEINRKMKQIQNNKYGYPNQHHVDARHVTKPKREYNELKNKKIKIINEMKKYQGIVHNLNEDIDKIRSAEKKSNLTNTVTEHQIPINEFETKKIYIVNEKNSQVKESIDYTEQFENRSKK